MPGEITKVQTIETFGDVRRFILETVVALRDGDLDISRGMAIAANMKVLNDNIQVEINAAKLSIATDGRAHQFGRVVKMGRRLISDNTDAETSVEGAQS
ncbi:hypothetical protein [Nitrosospira briensis]|uniref:hypothetical protein n=1 Tax=Nitrosospira briensis TaxID=35799 RepID=UPI00046989CB|nr:hypothetical protein [Nitrosospira briensis]